MPDLPQRASVVVIGGGVMGASVAYHLALRGERDVVLLEMQPFFGQGATGKCAGGIRYQFSTAINVRLSQLSLPMLRRFEEETDQAIDLRWPGYLFLLTTEEDVAKFRHNVAMQHSLGVQTEWLSGDEVRRRSCCARTTCSPVPSTRTTASPTPTAWSPATSAPGSGWACALSPIRPSPASPWKAGASPGWRRLTGASPATPSSTPPAPGRALWASWRAWRIVVRRQIVTTTPIPSLPADFPFVIDFAQSLYFHREGEGLLTGMSNPDEPAGFDESVDPDWELVHLEKAIERLPILERAGLQSHWAGLYEVTPDAHPIIGAVPEVEGLYVVAGFSGHGFMHGPIAGLLLTEIILDGEATTLDISELAYSRFAEGRLVEEYNVV